MVDELAAEFFGGEVEVVPIVVGGFSSLELTLHEGMIQELELVSFQFPDAVLFQVGDLAAVIFDADECFDQCLDEYPYFLFCQSTLSFRFPFDVLLQACPIHFEQ